MHRLEEDRGSSPLARGLRLGLHHRGPPVGIIPARAGFTGPTLWLWTGTADHPRSRGVYVGVNGAPANGPGSSPLARGLPGGDLAGAEFAGIIPARAGFTAPPTCRPSPRGDHPRSRGVYARQALDAEPVDGSSPLARGLQGLQGGQLQGPGIIPARAGFTGRRASACPRRSDHPRSRGVYERALNRTARGAGSSPLARGLPRR